MLPLALGRTAMRLRLTRQMAPLLALLVSGATLRAADPVQVELVPEQLWSLWVVEQRSLSFSRPAAPMSPQNGTASGASLSIPLGADGASPSQTSLGGQSASMSAQEWDNRWAAFSRPVQPLLPSASPPQTDPPSIQPSQESMPASVVPSPALVVPPFSSALEARRRATPGASLLSGSLLPASPSQAVAPSSSVTPTSSQPTQQADPQPNGASSEPSDGASVSRSRRSRLSGRRSTASPTTSSRALSQSGNASRESAAAYSKATQPASRRRSLGNLPPDDPRAYPALYGPQVGSPLVYPRRSLGNVRPGDPTQYGAIQGSGRLAPGVTVPYQGYSRYGAGYSLPGNAATAGSAGSAAATYLRRSMGNRGQIRRSTPGATVPSQAWQRRSTGNRGPVTPAP
jgi:hypothetical protein